MVTKLDKSVNMPLKNFIISMPSFGNRIQKGLGDIVDGDYEPKEKNRKKSDDIIDALFALDLSLF